jgi:HK97 family phage major capsid protein
MTDFLAKGSLFPESLVTDMFNKVKGHSSIARLCNQSPIAFNGQKEFTFSLDKEIDVVAENGAKTKGGATIAPVTIVPVKVEYGLRVSDEFMYASEDVQLDYLTSFSDGFANKLARGIDIMAIHGFNPRTAAASAVIGDNNFDTAVTNIVTEATATADEDIESAIALVQAADNDVNGMILSSTTRGKLAKLVDGQNRRLYPELAWGNNPGTLNGLAADVNSTISFNSSKDRVLVGDFVNAFKWGFAKQMPIEVIQYGNPDNDATLGDLKGHNQVYLRGEAYVGWGILDPLAFALIKAAA